MDIVNVDWLEKNLNNDDVIILDCSWHLPNTNRSGEKDFLSERIPGAIFLILMIFQTQKVRIHI